MRIKLTHTGKFTQGNYNDMEAGYPVFIDGKSLSDLVKDLLMEQGLNTNFCDDYSEGEKVSDNKLIGRRVTLTLGVVDDGDGGGG